MWERQNLCRQSKIVVDRLGEGSLGDDGLTDSVSASQDNESCEDERWLQLHKHVSVLATWTVHLKNGKMYIFMSCVCFTTVKTKIKQ